MKLIDDIQYYDWMKSQGPGEFTEADFVFTHVSGDFLKEWQ